MNFTSIDFKVLQQQTAELFRESLMQFYPEMRWNYFIDQISINCRSENECVEVFKDTFRELVDEKLQELLMRVPDLQNYENLYNYEQDMAYWTHLFTLSNQNKYTIVPLQTEKNLSLVVNVFRLFSITPAGSTNLQLLIQHVRSSLRRRSDFVFVLTSSLDPLLWQSLNRQLSRSTANAVLNSLFFETYADLKHYKDVAVVKRAIEYVTDTAFT